MTNVIDRARERIERDGWLKGSFGRPGGPMCVAGAVMQEHLLALDTDHAMPLPGSMPGLRAVAAEVGTGVLRIAEWNDDASTSLEDVLLVMKRASARLDEEAAS